MQVAQDHYQELGVLPNASEAEIREAYLKLAFQYHPDRNPANPETNEIMKNINEAYAILSNPQKRQEYDIHWGYRIVTPRFKMGTKVRINSHSNTPFVDHKGVVDKEPVKDAFRFWYIVNLQFGGISATGRFAEEELDETSD